jgi:hypothetical protein
VLGSDFLLPNGSTDTVLMADFSARSNPLLASETIYQLEAGARQRIGSQTLLFFGAGTELTGNPDRARLRLRIGITHVY